LKTCHQSSLAMPIDLAQTLYRSEAFAEDLMAEADSQTVSGRRHGTGAWLVNLLPLGVALLGLAFAVLPPLS
jgi:hypothetical protein